MNNKEEDFSKDLIFYHTSFIGVHVLRRILSRSCVWLVLKVHLALALFLRIFHRFIGFYFKARRRTFVAAE